MRIAFGGRISVTATDYWLALVRGGKAFSGGQTVGASAGNYSCLQLKNVIGSGKQVIVRDVLVSSGATAIQIRYYDTDLTTDDGAVVNLLAGGSAGSSHVREATPAAIPGTLIGTYTVVANTVVQLGGDWIGELSPGNGIVLVSAGVNMALSCTYRLAEV